MCKIKYANYYTDEVNENEKFFDMLFVDIKNKTFTFSTHVVELDVDSYYDDGTENETLATYLPRNVLMCLLDGLKLNGFKEE